LPYDPKVRLVAENVPMVFLFLCSLLIGVASRLYFCCSLLVIDDGGRDGGAIADKEDREEAGQTVQHRRAAVGGKQIASGSLPSS
jgi:hypothetical protein